MRTVLEAWHTVAREAGLDDEAIRTYVRDRLASHLDPSLPFRYARLGRVPNDVEKTSRGSEHVGLGSWAMPDLRGYPDMGRPVGRDPEPIVRWCYRGHRRQAASSAAVGTGVANARARSDQPSSFRKQICPEATRP